MIVTVSKRALGLALCTLTWPLPAVVAAEPASNNALPVPASTTAATVSLEIPPGPLATALTQVAQVAGVHLAVDSALVAGKSTPGIKGSFTPKAAFERLLAGSELTARKTAQGFVIERRPITSSNALTLDTLVVTAAGFAQDELDAPASTSVIPREELEQRYYNDITDALRSTPGVIVTGGGSGDNGTDISLRGLSSNYTLLLVDGKRQSSRESRPNGSAGFEQDWLPPMGAIDRIEVVRGPMSTLYGSDAIGGVINVITRKVPERWGGNVAVDTVFQKDGDSGNIEQGNFYLSGPLVTDKLGLQLFGRTYHRDEDNIANGYEEKDLHSVSGRLAYTPTENQELILEAGKAKQERKGRLGRSEPTEDCGRGGCSASYSEHEREYTSLSHVGRWGFATSDSYVQREKTTNFGRDIEIMNTVAKTSWVLPLDAHILTVGGQYEDEELNDGTTNQISDRTAIEHSQWAVFAENEWMATDTFSLTLGARLDDDENYGSHVSPRLYGVWHLKPQWTLKGGVSTGFRSPSLREVTLDWGQASRGGNVYGNPDLEPETSINQEIGLHYTSPKERVRTGITVFYNDFDDKITRVSCPDTICSGGPNQFGSLPTYRINVDKAMTQGIEWSLQALLAPALTLTTSYTFTDSEQKSGEYKGSPLTQLPEHLANINLNWQVREPLAAWLGVTYRGEESPSTSGPSSGDTIAPDYTLVDAGLNYQLTDALTAKAAVYNLMDEDITVEEYSYVEDGRRYWVGLDFAF